MVDILGRVTFSEALMIRWEGNSYTGEGEDYSKLVWHDGNKDSKPTEEEINDAIASLQAEYDAQDYARKRQAEFPTVKELVVALYDSDDKAVVDEKRAAVKLKYPKP